MLQYVLNLPASAGDGRDAGSIPGSGRVPGGGHANPLQYSGLENPMDRGAWNTTVYRVAKSWTWLKQHSIAHSTGITSNLKIICSICEDVHRVHAKTQHSENEDHSIRSHHFMAIRWGYTGISDRLSFWSPKSLQLVTTAMKLKDACSL